MPRFSIFSDEKRLEQSIKDVHSKLKDGCDTKAIPESLADIYQEKEIEKLLQIIKSINNENPNSLKKAIFKSAAFTALLINFLTVYLLFYDGINQDWNQSIRLFLLLSSNIIVIIGILNRYTFLYIFAIACGILMLYPEAQFRLLTKYLSTTLSIYIIAVTVVIALVLIFFSWILKRSSSIELYSVSKILKQNSLDFEEFLTK